MSPKVKKLRIAVVEDDLAMRSMIGDFLEQQGHEVEQFARSKDLLQSVTQAFDLVITDMNMPGQSGIELIEALQKTHPQLPVILITAFGNDKVKSLAKDAGAAGYLNKPFRLSDLQQAIYEAYSTVA